MIRIVDYGVGNIQAFVTMFKKLGIPAALAYCPADLVDATRLILPGVGAFDHAMRLLNQSGLREPLEAMVLGQQVPVLGICVGMQMLASYSDEGALPGLNWIPGRVRAFASSPETSQLPLPHMGWNDLDVKLGAKLFTGIELQPRFYFLHSYYFACDDPDHVVARSFYGLQFDCAVSKGHIHGVQCHAEKSHRFGAQLLRNFALL
jgi:glutamine amidotransferase